jgi:hypothetical protein
MSCKPQWWPEEVVWRNPNNRSTAGPKMKSAELVLVVSAFRDWYGSISHPGAGPSHAEQSECGNDPQNLLVSALSECDWTAEENQLIEELMKGGENLQVQYVLNKFFYIQ